MSILDELKKTKHKVLVIDDGSEYNFETLSTIDRSDWKLLSNPFNGGKEKFWERWLEALSGFKESNEEYVLFLPDDVSNIQIDKIDNLCNQGWDDYLFAVNVLNDGRENCWGEFSLGQIEINIDKVKYREVGFVDCGFLSNRNTMSKINIDEVPKSWFNRSDKSSGVGYQLTTKMRELGVRMMTPDKSLAYHGDHDSVMHPEERKNNPLISK